MGGRILLDGRPVTIVGVVRRYDGVAPLSDDAWILEPRAEAYASTDGSVSQTRTLRAETVLVLRTRSVKRTVLPARTRERVAFLVIETAGCVPPPGEGSGRGNGAGELAK